MGCDIHSFAEVRKNSKWEKVGEVFPLDDWDKNYFKKDFGDSPINWRDYSLYGWLADVRNYSCVPAISQPRGIPDDISPEVAQENNDWAADGHSHSWLLPMKAKVSTSPCANICLKDISGFLKH